MAQPILFASAYLMLIFHTLAVSLYGGPWALRISYIVGPLTGMWNHGSTSQWAKWADRIAMAIGFCVDVWYIALLADVLVGLLLATAVAFYLGAKAVHVYTTKTDKSCHSQHALHDLFNTSVLLHWLSHAFVTAAHVCFLQRMA
jgi:hypothetical protein